jgi:hypothetical protein
MGDSAVIDASGRRRSTGLHMLPNLKFLVCGILFCVLLFAAAGAGVMLPDSRTRIGEMPEIGRPMMQRSMADVPAQAQVYMMTAARRSDELEQLREPAAATPPEPDLLKPDLPKADLPKPDPANADAVQQDWPKPDVVAAATTDGARVVNPAVNPAPGTSPGEAATSIHPPAAPPDPPAETRRDDSTDEARPPQQVAALAPAAEPAAEERTPVPRYVNVPLPLPRPAVFNREHAHMLHHRRRVAPPHDTANPGLAAGQVAPAAQTAPVYTPSEAASR